MIFAAIPKYVPKQH